MEELKRVQGSTFDGFARRKLIEDRDTVLELMGKNLELQNEINCMNDSRDFQDAESVRSGQSHVTSQPALLPPCRDPGRLLSRNNQPPDIRNTQGISGNVFANPRAPSSSPYPGGFNPWIFEVTGDTSPHVTSESQNPDTPLDPRCQSGPSARNSFDPKEGRSSKDYGADQQRLQISELHFDKFPTPTTFACWKIRFKTEVCTCSQFSSLALLWIKEVEMVESVDDLKSSRSIKGTHGPDFELLDAKIASALKNHPNTRFKRKVVWRKWKLPQKTVSFEEDRSLTWTVPGHRGQWFCRELCRPIYNFLKTDNIQEFDSNGTDSIIMTNIPSDASWKFCTN